MEQGNEAKWTLVEPTEEEFEERRKTENHYRIYTIRNGVDVSLYKFWEKDDDSALKVLNAYKEEHKDTGEEYFYSTSGYHIDSDGKRYDSIEQMTREWTAKRGTISKIKDFFVYDLWGWITEGWYNFKDTMAFNKEGHSLKEWWSLDYHILEDLKYNLPILAAKHTGVPTFICDRACKELGKEFPKDGDYGDEVTNLASKMWEDELMKLLENVLLYQYYEGYGHFDSDKDKMMVEIDKKYRHTLPYKAGTNKEFDYDKLHLLTQERWNAIWDWIKENGQALWD